MRKIGVDEVARDFTNTLESLAQTKYKNNQSWQGAFWMYKTMIKGWQLKFSKPKRGGESFERDSAHAKQDKESIPRSLNVHDYYEAFNLARVKELTADEFASEIQELINYLFNSQET